MLLLLRLQVVAVHPEVLDGNLVHLLKRAENNHSFCGLSSLSVFGRGVDLANDILAVFKDRDKQHFLDDSLNPVLLDLLENHFDLKWLLTHELRHLLLEVLLLHVDCAHGELGRHDLLVAVVADELWVDHAWLHVQVLVVEELRLAHSLHVLRSLALRVRL